MTGTNGTPGPALAPASVVAGVRIERDVAMTTRDGVVLRADVFRPEQAERPLPVLLMRTPYDKAMCDDATYQHPAWYARQGFIVVIQDVRGRGASDGTFTPFVHEEADGYDSVEWAAGLPGSNGRVGMYGASYPGLVQYQAAVQRPPSLGAICPAVTTADIHGHWTYEGGALNLGTVAWWAAALSGVEAVRHGWKEIAPRLAQPVMDPSAWFTSAAPADLDPLRECAPWYLEWLAHPTRDDWWRALSPDERLADVSVPVLGIAGWFDVFLGGAVRDHRRLVELGRPDQHLLVGPWMHYPWGRQAWDLRSGPDSPGSVLVDRAQVRFFHRHLDPGRSGADDAQDPVVRYYTLYEDAWREAASWPPPGAVERSLYLSSGGAANGAGGDGRLVDEPPDSNEPDVYNYLPAIPVPAHGGHSCCYPGRSPMGVADQTPVEDLTQVLVYTSEALREPLVLAGDVRAELWVATDAPSADYVARLCVVDEDGSWNVAEGITRVPVGGTTVNGPGAPFPVRISLRSIAARVDAGKRLRAHVTSGSSPTWSTNPQTGASPEHTAPAEGRAALHVVLHDAGHPSRVVMTVLPA
jgi:uncharacterized protein